MRYILAVPLLALWAMAAVPSFMEPVILQADGSDIDVGVISDPFMTDWDGDGVTDLLVGQFSPGKVRYYRTSDRIRILNSPSQATCRLTGQTFP